MARIIDAFSQFFDGNGEPLSNGYLQFFQNETAIPEPTYNDPDQTIPNPTDIPLDGEGRMTLNTYASVLCTVKLFNSVGSQIESEDNVTPRGGLSAGAAFDFWNSTLNYQAIASVVTGSDDNYYKAKTNNVNIDPVVDFAAGGENWERVYFNEFYSEFKTYAEKDRVTFAGDLNNYISLKGSNIDNQPDLDDGTNWLLDNPVYNWVIGKTYEIDEQAYSTVNNRRYKAVISQAGNEPSADDGTNWLPTDGVVTKPVNALPTDEATDVSRTPLLTVDAYAVTGSDAAQEWIQYQLSDDAFTSIAYDSGITRDFDGHTVTDPLVNATEYSYRALTKGVRTDITDWSDVTTFTTTANLSEVFAINQETGSGALRTTVTGVDLNAGTGSIWIKNRDTTGFIKQLDTSRNLEELDIAEGSPEATNANGLQQYFSNGFEVGTDASYNGSANTISSYTFKKSTGFYDVVQYVGNASSRNIAHSLGVQAGAVIVKNLDGTTSLNNRHWINHDNFAVSGFGISLDGASNSGGLFLTLTDTTFGISTSTSTNNTGDTYVAEIFAHNPTAGIYCGTYTGTGSTQSIVTGFPVGWLMTIYVGASGGTMIADIEAGTSSHIFADENGNAEVAGSVASFDSDGFTLDSNSLNISGETYYFIAIADPSVF